MSSVHAAIDIGTNSIHMVVARMRADGGFEILAQEKEPARLGSGAGDMHQLTPAAMDRGVDALRRLRQVADIFEADITAVATSAVREADNQAEFIGRSEREAGIDVEVISGVEEARLIHLGVLQALPVLDERLLVIDIGGGSTELLFGSRGNVLGVRSVKLGHLRLTNRFFPGGKINDESVEKCRTYIRSFLAHAARELRPIGYEVAVGCSGTIETVARVAAMRHGDRAPQHLNGFVVDRAALADVVELVLDARTAKQRNAVAGIDQRRADVIVGGALLLEQIFDAFGIDELTLSEYALREGLFLDRFHEQHGESFHHLSDIRREGVMRLAELFREDQPHIEHSTDLALQIFDTTAVAHGLGLAERDYLEAASLLHNVGLFISHAAHHKHSYYVIRNSDQLLGFADHEIELIAQVARYHRKSEPKMKHLEFAGLSNRDQQVVRSLAGILRVAIALDRSHDHRVESIDVVLTDEQLVITTEGERDRSLEHFTANERKGLLASALGRPVIVD